jgi:hypothetical protein
MDGKAMYDEVLQSFFLLWTPWRKNQILLNNWSLNQILLFMGAWIINNFTFELKISRGILMN